MPFIFTQNFKTKFASLKIERLILSIPLNTIENGIGKEMLTANVFNETFVGTCLFCHSALLENTKACNYRVRNNCNIC